MESREYNRREGIGQEHDKLPLALMRKNDEGHQLAEEDLHTMVREYNEIREARLDA